MENTHLALEQPSRHGLARRLGLVLAGLLALYLVGRGVAGFFTIDYSDPASYALKTWGLKRSAQYGSKHIDEKPLVVSAAALGTDGKTVRLMIPDIAPTWGMEVKYRLKGADGRAVSGTFHNTMHALPEK